MYNIDNVKKINESRRLSVSLPGFENLKNPIFLASGCANFGKEYEGFIDLNQLGGITLKSITKEKRDGNPTPRVGELDLGMINSIGLANPGMENVDNEIKYFDNIDCGVLANVAGSDEEEYLDVVKKLNEYEQIHAYEINVSCPNVKKGAMQIGQDPILLKQLVSKIKEISKKPVYVKLTPNTSDIVKQAKAASEGGADGITMINTLSGMGIDYRTGRPIIAMKGGGVSGPLLKPIALKMIYDVASNVDIPIIGMGGISSAKDVVEFMQAGASAVAIGTANLINPTISMEIIEDLDRILDEIKIDKVSDLIKMTHKY